MNIDTATGLPALPDNQFWRVHDTRTNFGVRLEIRESVEKEVELPRKFFQLKPRFKSELVDELVEYVNLFKFTPRPDDESETITVFGDSAEGRVIHDQRGEYTYYSVQYLAAHPELIRAAAQKLVKRRAARVEAKLAYEAAAEKILGDYPPKSLPTPHFDLSKDAT